LVAVPQRNPHQFKLRTDKILMMAFYSEVELKAINGKRA
jgi:hypothetical protein